MDAWQTVIVLTLMAGMAMPLGAWLALVLVPDSLPALDIATATACFVAGGVAFMALDIALNRSGTSASHMLLV